MRVVRLACGIDIVTVLAADLVSQTQPRFSSERSAVSKSALGIKSQHAHMSSFE
jgi:hypothetical protein